MAESEKVDAVVNAGEQVSVPVSALPLKPDEQFRLVNQRLDNLKDELSRVSKPPQFRLADGVELATIILALIVAWFTAMGLNDRISDVNAHQAETERRLESHMDAMETRLGQKMDKLGDQFTRMDERTSTLEGKLSSKPK